MLGFDRPHIKLYIFASPLKNYAVKRNLNEESKDLLVKENKEIAILIVYKSNDLYLL